MFFVSALLLLFYFFREPDKREKRRRCGGGGGGCNSSILTACHLNQSLSWQQWTESRLQQDQYTGLKGWSTCCACGSLSSFPDVA